MPKRKKFKARNTPMTQKGMGDFYGSGIRNPQGRLRQSFIFPSKRDDVGKPPRALA